MYFFTYVLKSKVDGKLYIGSTGNIKKRLNAHNAGEVTSTKSRRPLELIYFEACIKREKAEYKERYFKTGFGRQFLKTRL